jgi:hypothetical protein
LLRDCAQLLQHVSQLLFQQRDFFFLRHVLSIANKGLSEQYRLGRLDKCSMNLLYSATILLERLL